MDAADRAYYFSLADSRIIFAKSISVVCAENCGNYGGRRFDGVEALSRLRGLGQWGVPEKAMVFGHAKMGRILWLHEGSGTPLDRAEVSWIASRFMAIRSSRATRAPRRA